jgi:hypothetical protein
MPKTKRAKLEAKLDKVFSLYIRLRDAKDEFCTCVTCGKTKHYKDGIHCHVGIRLLDGMKRTHILNVLDAIRLIRENNINTLYT